MIKDFQDYLLIGMMFVFTLMAFYAIVIGI